LAAQPPPPVGLGAGVAFDHDLAGRVRERFAGELGIAEQAMFGGLAFLGLWGDDLMVRVGPDGSDAALAMAHTRAFDVSGRAMKGWIRVAPRSSVAARCSAAMH
jgi:hypothetical protein